ncbi:MAG: response regulator [Spirochaetales bacterium]|nr:response regulator [Spirochaetales bacterium]
MEQTGIRRIIYYSPECKPDLEQFFHGKGIDIVYCQPKKQIITESECGQADLLLYISDHENPDIGIFSEICSRLPALLLCKPYDPGLVRQALETGFIDVLPYPGSPGQMEAQYQRLNRRLTDKWKMEALYEGLKASESHLLEKNTILETILDILTHDTGNIFINLNSLVEELPDTPLRGMIKDNINDLYNMMHEAVGYLGHKKRILNIVELLKGLVVSSMRVPLEFHGRIEFSHSSRFVLFAECTPLFRNALMNIIENALKYSPEESIVRVHAVRKDNEIEITIADNGSGIPDSEKEQIFSRYYRRKETIRQSGSGRGLWITRNILEKNGGRLSVSDNKPQGAVFHVIVPAFVLGDPEQGMVRLMDWYGLSHTQIKNKMEAMETLLNLQDIPDLDDLPSAVFCNLLEHLRKQRNEKEAIVFRDRMNEYKRLNPGAPKILIVDDSLYVKYYLASYLVELGYSIAEYASTGEEAVSLHRELRPDLVTMDCTMPVMSGLEAARRICENDTSVPLLFITGIGNHPLFLRDLDKYFSKNRYAVLTKPFKKDELKRDLSRLLS